MVVGRLEEHEMRLETAVTLTKMRWSWRLKGQEGLTAAERAETEQETDQERLERESGRATERRSVDLRHLRATDMRNNWHVQMPGPSTVLVEAVNNIRTGLWMREFLAFKEKECNSKGDQNNMNLTPGQLVALNNLEQRVNKTEIVVLQADKGKRVVVMDPETYLRMAEEHVVPTDEIDEKAFRKSQQLLSATAKGLAVVLGVGSSQLARNSNRCDDNVRSQAEDAATLKLLPKVHKVAREGGHPQS